MTKRPSKSAGKKPAAPGKRGRPAFKATEEQRKQVKAMAGYGIAHEEIALVLGVTAPTLRKHFRAELDTGHVIANAKVAESLFRMAAGGPVQYDEQGRIVREEQKPDKTAAIWWTKARMGWSDSQGEERGPVGKKEKAAAAAQRAGEGSDWGDDLKFDGENVVPMKR